MQKKGARLIGAALFAAMMVPASAADAQSYWQCVPFARMISGIDLFGRAASWWHKAVGRYEQGSLPRAGAVLVFKAISSMRSGHVATVSRVISDRVIEVTHANWSLIHGRRGQIERNVKVVDVSPANDWSRVRVWWAPSQDLGTTAYPTFGFIYGTPAKSIPAPTMASVAVKSMASTLLASLPAGKSGAMPAFALRTSLTSFRSPAAIRANMVTLASTPRAQSALKAPAGDLPTLPADRRETLAARAAPAAQVKTLLVSTPPAVLATRSKMTVN